jgi:hypothetical protein
LFHENFKKSGAGPVGFLTQSSGENRPVSSGISVKIAAFYSLVRTHLSPKATSSFGLKSG